MMSPVNEAILLDQPVLSRIGIEDREISQTTSHPHKRPTGLGIRSTNKAKNGIGGYLDEYEFPEAFV